MTKDYLRKGRNFEILIRRAYNCERGRKYGADAALYLELVKLELEDNESIKYKWRFQKLKNYINKALSKLRKRKRYHESDNIFSPIQLELIKAKNVDDLAKIASLGLAKVIECENRSRKISKQFSKVQ